MHFTKHFKKILAEDIGWYGMIAILVAYGLNNFHVLSQENISYQLLNLTGALALGYISFVKKTWQTFMLNVVWACIAGISLVQILITTNT